MDTIVPESWITLDTRLLGKNIVILALEIAYDLSKASQQPISNGALICVSGLNYLASLSI